MSVPRIAYAGNRPLAVACLRTLLEAGLTPVALLTASADRAEGAEEMQKLLPDVPHFQGPVMIEQMKDLPIDYLLSVHFPHILPSDVLKLPAIGSLNLHPAYLPYNRGWHTASWAIWEKTPYGATLHWIAEGLDDGDIALQKQIDVRETDTAHILYQRVLQLEEELFAAAVPLLLKNKLQRKPQQGDGTSHRKADLQAIRKIDENMKLPDVCRLVRALSTNDPAEAAYFEKDLPANRVRVS